MRFARAVPALPTLPTVATVPTVRYASEQILNIIAHQLERSINTTGCGGAEGEGEWEGASLVGHAVSFQLQLQSLQLAAEIV